MGQDTVRLDRSLLLQQAEWVRSLARNLVRDPVGADDVAQETLLAALASPPKDAADARHLRAWLGRVAFNLAHLSTRRTMRRRAREERVARAERTDSTADRVIRGSVLEKVVDAVAELPEPYRTAVRLHYFEGRSTAAIARETGTSETAVRKRLWRARGRLRRTLDSCHNGERQAWFQALAPLIGAPAALRPATTASLATAPKLAAVVLVGLGVGFGWHRVSKSAALEAPRAGSAGLAEGVHTAGLSAPDPREPVLFSPRVASTDSSRRGDATRNERSGGPEMGVLSTTGHSRSGRSRAGGSFRARILDLHGTPLGGLPVAAESAPGTPLAWSDAGGSFRVGRGDLAPETTLIVARAEWATLRAPRLRSSDAWLLAAPAVDLAGRVLMDGGRSPAGVRVSVRVRDEAFAGLERRVGADELRLPACEVRADGSFTIDRVPSAEGIELTFSRGATLLGAVPVPAFSDGAMWIDLGEGVELRSRIAGRVRDDRGAPVGGARVSLGERSTWTDGAGRFVFEGAGDADPDELTASKPGFAGSHLAYAGDSAPSEARVLNVELAIAGTQDTIEGHVEGERGAAFLGWVVFATPAEGEDGSTGADFGGSGRLGEPGAPPAPVANTAVAEPVRADGSFRLFVAADRPWRVLAFDPERGSFTRVATVRAGEQGVSLAVVERHDDARLALLGSDGAPLAGREFSAELVGEGTGGRFAGLLASSVTDGSGVAALPAVDFGLSLRVFDPSLGWSPAVPAPRRGGSVVLARPGALVVDAVDWAGVAASVAAEDAAGLPVDFGAPSGRRARVSLAGGRAPLLELPSEARTLLLLDASGRVLARDTLEPTAGTITHARF